MTKVLVLDGGAMIGSGYIIEYADGGFYVPALIDLTGNEIPQGTYDLRKTDESFPVIVPQRAQ